MAFGQSNNLNSYSTDYLRDWQHASKVFRTNGYQNSPRFKFLFHVYFTINFTEIPPLQNIFGSDISTVGLLVKNIQLPTYSIATDTLNQYNRKRIVQKKIEYQPVQIEFHDDGGDLIRTMWYNYYSYYYKDPSQKYGNQSSTNGALGVDSNSSAGFNYNARDIYANDRSVNDWGFIGESYSDGTSSGSGKPKVRARPETPLKGALSPQKRVRVQVGKTESTFADFLEFKTSGSPVPWDIAPVRATTTGIISLPLC
jgi:hypothetical protein